MSTIADIERKRVAFMYLAYEIEGRIRRDFLEPVAQELLRKIDADMPKPPANQGSAG